MYGIMTLLISSDSVLDVLSLQPVCVCVCDHFLMFSARVSCRFLKLVIITVRVREPDKCPRLESNGRNVH